MLLAEAEMMLDSIEAEELNQQDQQLNQRLSISRHDLGMSRCAVPLWNRSTHNTDRGRTLALPEQLRQQQDELSQQLGGTGSTAQNCVKTSERLRIKLKNSSRNTAAGRPCLN